jgi:periplasmic protein TonB
VTDIKLPLGLSVAAHAVVLAALITLLPAAAPPLPILPATGGIEVVFAPPPPQPEAPPVQAETPPPPVETPPPEPQPAPPPDEPVAVTEPPPPALEVPAPVVEPPPSPHKPVVKRPPKPVVRQPQPTPAFAPPQPTPAPSPVAPQQTAMAPTPAPAPAPSPEISPGYLGLLSAWLNSHKRYPDSARQHGEEGRAVLHFDVDRTGHVLDFAVIKSSGYADLDAAIEEMMSGAILPPFPAGMTESRLPVSVTIRFSLTR